LSEVFPSGQHLVAIDAKPLFKFFFARRSQIGFTPLLDERRKDKLCTHDASHSDRGRKVIATIAQFDVIAEVWNVVTHQGLQGFSFGANLKGARRV
jgi:hypothetical protein